MSSLPRSRCVDAWRGMSLGRSRSVSLRPSVYAPRLTYCVISVAFLPAKQGSCYSRMARGLDSTRWSSAVRGLCGSPGSTHNHRSALPRLQLQALRLLGRLSHAFRHSSDLSCSAATFAMRPIVPPKPFVYPTGHQGLEYEAVGTYPGEPTSCEPANPDEPRETRLYIPLRLSASLAPRMSKSSPRS